MSTPTPPLTVRMTPWSNPAPERMFTPDVVRASEDDEAELWEDSESESDCADSEPDWPDVDPDEDDPEDESASDELLDEELESELLEPEDESASSALSDEELGSELDPEDSAEPELCELEDGCSDELRCSALSWFEPDEELAGSSSSGTSRYSCQIQPVCPFTRT